MGNLYLLAITLNYTVSYLGPVLIESSWSTLPYVFPSDYFSILYHFHFPSVIPNSSSEESYDSGLLTTFYFCKAKGLGENSPLHKSSGMVESKF